MMLGLNISHPAAPTRLNLRALAAIVALAAVATVSQSTLADERKDVVAHERLLLQDISNRAGDAIAAVTSHALSLIGVRYKFGSEDPARGLDCSGLIRYVFQQATGISLPRTAREQAKVGDAVAMSELQPGDLVFFNTRRFQFSHVGIYLGNNEFIHAPSRGRTVEVVRLDQAYWQRAFNGARRIVVAVPRLAASTIAPAAHAADALQKQDDAQFTNGTLQPAALDSSP
ncbi:MAG: C40 family peptidase [Casimicrobiaceae bacterium]